jgi:hypothetical protein
MSNTNPQSDFNRRMFRYFARLHETHALPVYPIVIFSHDSPRRPEPDSYRVEFSDLLVLEFHYRVIQLNRLQWQDFVNQPNPVASALMAKMRIEPQERPTVKVECLRLLASLGLNPAQIQLISGFIDTYLKLSQTEQVRFQAELVINLLSSYDLRSAFCLLPFAFCLLPSIQRYTQESSALRQRSN